MNKIFKVIYSRTRDKYVVVDEICHSHSCHSVKTASISKKLVMGILCTLTALSFGTSFAADPAAAAESHPIDIVMQHTTPNVSTQNFNYRFYVDSWWGNHYDEQASVSNLPTNISQKDALELKNAMINGKIDEFNATHGTNVTLWSSAKVL